MSSTIPIPRSHPSASAHPPPTTTTNPPLSSSISSTTSSLRHSQMPPPPLPHTHSYSSTSSTPSMHSPKLAYHDLGVGPGPGPQRLPRQLTPAELHLELEKEQEGIVNRLTRELQMLRSRSREGESHDAETASNSATPSRLRSSSQTSSISRHSGIRTGHSTPPVHGHGYYTPSHGGHSLSSSAVANMPLSDMTGSQVEFSLSSSYSSDVGGLEEAIRWKRELEVVSKENESLRDRVKELERQLRKLKVKKREDGSTAESTESLTSGEGQALTEGNLREHDKE